MWAIISNHSELRFYSCASKPAVGIDDVNYERISTSGTHESIVSKLIRSGVPLFIKKSDARAKAVEWNLKGFKYIELSPSVIAL